MIFSKRSPVTGKTNTMDLPITDAHIEAWAGGQVIQQAMPHLTPDQREFLISGITPEEWHETFGTAS